MQQKQTELFSKNMGNMLNVKLIKHAKGAALTMSIFKLSTKLYRLKRTAEISKQYLEIWRKVRDGFVCLEVLCYTSSKEFQQRRRREYMQNASFKLLTRTQRGKSDVVVKLSAIWG